MLAALPETDLFQNPPDAEGINILSPKFGTKDIPSGRGVYCFYSPITNEPVYIGSACGTRGGSSAYGLLLRMRLYRQKKSKSHDLKIYTTVRDEGLLLKIWLTRSEADARKYEADAIRRYRPRLNVVGCRELSTEEVRLKANERNRQERLKRLARTPNQYNATTTRLCSKCTQEKMSAAFRRCKGKLMGTHPVCRDCEAAERSRQAEANGIVHRKLSNDELVLLSRDDLSLREIARRLGIDHKGVAARREKLGLAMPDPKSKVQGCYEALAALISGLPLGAKLPTQQDLATELRISWPTIRKAQRVLQKEGRLLVTNRGVWVAA